MAQNQQYYGRGQPQQHQLSHQVAKTTAAVTIGGFLMVLSGLTLAATVIGFLASGGFGASASFVFYWMYRYATGKHPIGADELDRAREKLAHTAHDMKEKVEQFGQHHIKGSQDT
ncbi:oleosin 1-like [Olea europaea var. sylvestris]|uniref:oleosin 1-like n=1 Tax=Olea europaea var. sylvestris TaxID=158386 RepID=UPI000C1D6A90|nr:oleosin 1-like [Olea europaea var. sylvestris]